MKPNDTGYKELTGSIDSFVIFIVNNPISMEWVEAMDAHNPADLTHPHFQAHP